jgi:hypothetical protein
MGLSLIITACGGGSTNTTPPPTTYVLTVNSTNLASSVAITVSPADNNGSSGGSTSFTRTYDASASVTLTAPATSGGNTFKSWSGCTSTTTVACTVVLNANTTVTANYIVPTFTLTVNSTNPASGVAIGVSPADSNNATDGSTSFTRTYLSGTSVTLTAPATSGSNDFSSWSGCTTYSTETCYVTMNAAVTVTANYTPPTTVTVSTPGSSVTVTDQILGMNMAAWYDLVSNKTAILDGFQAAGIKAVRWPGGSWSDLYHWQTNTNCQNGPYGGGTPDSNDVFANFVSDLAVPAGLDVALTADYGTNPACNGGGEPSEAAAWVAAALTDGITVSHMTVGNEVYGSTWEEDLHSSPNDPTTYAAAVVGASGYYQAIKASSPKTRVGVVVDADNETNGWDNIVLANAKGYYDFVEFHYYPEAPGFENDSTLVGQDAQGLTTNINTIKSELTKWGTPDTPIYVGEMGSVYTNPGKQSTSITQALFAGQELGEMMNDGVSRATWWIGFGGCEDSASGTGANFSSSLYGWQDYGGYMVFSDGLPDGYECEHETLAAGTLLPTARAFQLFSNVAVTGESVLSASVTGDTTDVVAYAATHSGGTALVLFNRNETTAEPVAITLSGQTTATTVTVETYDKALYDLSGSPDGTIPDPAGTNTWAGPTSTNISSPTLPLTLTLTPWSMNVVIIH